MKALGLWVILVVILAACSGSPATTTSTAGATDVTSTTVAPTTTTTSASTIEPPTTTTQAPAHDTFVIAGNTCLLGWWDGEWQSEGAPPAQGGEEYQVVRLAEPITIARGTEPRPWCDPLDLLNIEFDPQLPGEWQDLDAIAIQTTADARPHKVELLSTSTAAYIDSTADLLAGRVASVPPINLTKVIRTDLEGDGVDEIIVAAGTMPDDPLSTAIDDYTIVYLRKLLDGDVQTALLGIHIAEEEGPFSWVKFEVAAVADLNADGQMEIVLSGNVWEGGFLQAFEWINNDLGPVEVLSCGCGA